MEVISIFFDVLIRILYDLFGDFLVDYVVNVLGGLFQNLYLWIKMKEKEREELLELSVVFMFVYFV